MGRTIRKFVVVGMILVLVAAVFASVPMNVSAEGEYSSYFAGGIGSLADPYQITNVVQLQNMNLDLSANYILVNDIDASATSSWNWNVDHYEGFVPIGSYPSWFSGTFDGKGHKITNLYIDRPSTDFVGLFGMNYQSEIKNVGLENIDITGCHYSGGLIGYNYYQSTISTSYTTGSVSGHNYIGGLSGYNQYFSVISKSYTTCSVTGSTFVGGLVGYNYKSTIESSYATGSVTGSDRTGGLVGFNYWYAKITDSYATGPVNGRSRVGGLVGDNYEYCTIESSYATGSVTGNGQHIGGLVGFNYKSTISKSYATGTVKVYCYFAGGLVGTNGAYSSISNSYATGSVTGVYYIGGLVGSNEYYSTISNSYAIGSVTGYFPYTGGLVGFNHLPNTISSSYWDTDTSGTLKGVGYGPHDGVFGKTTAEMKQQSTFVGWDFINIWRINNDYPYLSWQITNEPPVADAGADQTVVISETVTFDGSGSSDPDGTIESYTWDFGDSTPAGSGVSPTHAYSTAGIYTVTLSVEDDVGATDTDTVILTVLTAEEATEEIDDYIQDLPEEAFDCNAEQRSNALYEKLIENEEGDAVMQLIDS
ncbi:MAG: PKD domain-containing protein [Thermoplasmata archaeon]|nr:MAG: PKD domain-containing protein [Thermoplasmata archaeon]